MFGPILTGGPRVLNFFAQPHGRGSPCSAETETNRALPRPGLIGPTTNRYPAKARPIPNTLRARQVWDLPSDISSGKFRNQSDSYRPTFGHLAADANADSTLPSGTGRTSAPIHGDRDRQLPEASKRTTLAAYLAQVTPLHHGHKYIPAAGKRVSHGGEVKFGGGGTPQGIPNRCRKCEAQASTETSKCAQSDDPTDHTGHMARQEAIRVHRQGLPKNRSARQTISGNRGSPPCTTRKHDTPGYTAGGARQAQIESVHRIGAVPKARNASPWWQAIPPPRG